MPAVSVLMPVFDAQATLPLALESIRRQRGVDFECVAVDDGSTDGSAACLERLAQSDARFRVLRIEHGGIVRALNHGLAACRGAFVARMDADDVMRGDRLMAQLEHLALRPELAGVGCHVRSFPRRGLSQGRREYERWLNSLRSEDDVARDLLVECPLAHPTLLLRREIFQRFGYRDQSWPEDYDLILRLVRAGHALGVLPRRLLAWRDTPTRLSRQSSRYASDRFTALKADHLAQSWLARHPRYVLWGYGDTGRMLCRALLEHERRPHAIVELHPGRIGQRIQGARVIAPAALLEARQLGPDTLPVVVSVAHAAPRAEVRATLSRLGLRELVDFVCAA
jgi:glycosyltransferase involved in cell wall biosynthesis